MNVGHPLAAWFGAAFLIAVAIAARRRRVAGARSSSARVFASGCCCRRSGWAVTYLMAFWFAGVGIWLWLRR